MRKLIISFCTILFCIGFLGAQNRQILYDLYEAPQSLLLNPGVKTPYKWHAGIPGISGFAIQANTSGITVNDLFANDGLDFTDKVRERAVNRLSSRDEFGSNGQLDIINIGFRNKSNPNTYYSFGVYGEGFLTQFWPQDLAILAFEGNANNLDRRFDLNDIATQGDLVSVYHFGVTKKVSSKLSIGFRGKLYSSILEFKSSNNEGFFETTAGENNILRNTLVADVEFQTSGVREFLDILNDDSISAREEFPNLFLRRAFLGGNLGLGADIGFTYQLNKNTVITGSLLDVGFINNTRDVENYTLTGSASNEGLEIILPESLNNINGDIFQNLIDDIETLIPFETNDDSFITLRPIKLNASIRYNFNRRRSRRVNDCYCNRRRNNFFDYKSALGAHLFVINKINGPQAAFTAFYQTKIGNALALKTTYTANKFTFTNLGLGLNFQAGPVNFYILGDNLASYRNIADSNFASLQFGFNIISWNKN